MHIVLMSPIPFDELHQRPQKLAERFRDSGHQVLFVELGGIRATFRRPLAALVPALLEALLLHATALLGGTRGRRAGAAGARPAPAAGLEILAGPLVVPVHRSGAGWLSAWTVAVHRRFLERRVLSRYPAGVPVAAVVEYPFWGAVIAPGDFEALFYDCLDDFGSFAGRAGAASFARWEQRLLALGDGAFASARALEDHLRALAPGKPVQRVPNGVDADWFRERAAAAPRALPGGAPRRPVAGYVGVIGRWLDYALLDDVIAGCPEVDFVFVGPATEPRGLGRLRRHANFRWVDRRPYDEIPGIVRDFDLGLIPFAAGPIARTTNPVKVFEYFALGKPVVATPLEELEPWRATGLLVRADDAGSFRAAIRAAAAERDPSLAERRVQAAQANSWQARADEMLGTLAGALHERSRAGGVL